MDSGTWDGSPRSIRARGAEATMHTQYSGCPEPRAAGRGLSCVGGAGYLERGLSVGWGLSFGVGLS